MHMIGHTSNVECGREHILMRSLNAQDRLQSLYGDCIKLANENKITQKVRLYTAYKCCLKLTYTFVCMYMYTYIICMNIYIHTCMRRTTVVFFPFLSPQYCRAACARQITLVVIHSLIPAEHLEYECARPYTRNCLVSLDVIRSFL